MKKNNYLSNDRTLPKINKIIDRCEKLSDSEVVSIILFGSRAAGDRNSQNDYELLVLLHNETTLENYIRFNNTVRLELLKDKLANVKILAFTPQIFENVLFNDVLVGTYLFIICRDNLIILDKGNTFLSLLSRLTNNTLKPEEKFLEQCVELAKELGSEKWGRKWEKALLQCKYNRKRKSGRY